MADLLQEFTQCTACIECHQPSDDITSDHALIKGHNNFDYFEIAHKL